MNQSDLGMIVLFTAYGGTWLLTAVALWLYSERTAKLGIAADLRLLSLFAFVHGVSDIIDVALRIPGFRAAALGTLVTARLVLLVASFVILFQFGLAINIQDKRVYRSIIALGAFLILAIAATMLELYSQGPAILAMATVERASRLFICLPGALLAAVGFYRLSLKCRRLNLRGSARDAMGAAIFIAAYGILAGAVTSGYPTPTMILGLPVQLFRMAAALGLAVSCLSLLRRFQV